MTGAARGIGRAIVEAAASRGDPVIARDRDPTALAEAFPDVAGMTRVTLDVRDEAAWAELVEAVERDHGPIDVLDDPQDEVLVPGWPNRWLRLLGLFPGVLRRSMDRATARGREVPARRGG